MPPSFFWLSLPQTLRRHAPGNGDNRGRRRGGRKAMRQFHQVFSSAIFVRHFHLAFSPSTLVKTPVVKQLS